jgi:ketosteroid isomerase-like protein
MQGTIRNVLLLMGFAVATANAAPPGPAVQEITRLEYACNDAYAANDLAKYFACYADDMTAIFYNARTNLADYRKFWTESVRSGNPVLAVKVTDLVVRVSPTGDSAVASYQIHVRNGHADGRKTDEDAFETDVWQKRAGKWLIAHAHYALAVAPPP